MIWCHTSGKFTKASAGCEMPPLGQTPPYFLLLKFLNPPGPTGLIRLGQLISHPGAPTSITRSGPLDPKVFDLEVHSMPLKTFRHEN